MPGEDLPGKSEIWPQPMGHHIFLWRIPQASEGSSLSIKNNYFGPAPLGAATYSIISKEAQAQIFLDNNTCNKGLVVYYSDDCEHFYKQEELILSESNGTRKEMMSFRFCIKFIAS